MTRQSTTRLWTSLLSSINKIAAEDDVGLLLRTAQRWLRDNIAAFDPALRERYGLSRMCELDLARMPVGCTGMDARSEIQQLRRVSPSTSEALAMRLRDLIGSGVIVRSNRQCPNCGQDGLAVLEADTSGLVYACNFCNWAEDERGQRWSGGSALVPPDTETLQRHGLLSRTA